MIITKSEDNLSEKAVALLPNLEMSLNQVAAQSEVVKPKAGTASRRRSSAGKAPSGHTVRVPPTSSEAQAPRPKPRVQGLGYRV